MKGRPLLSSVSRTALLLPRAIVGFLVLLAIGTMLYGVFARYILLPITDWLDVDPVNFFWVEEVGETSLAWITLIGAAIGVGQRSHFTLSILVHRLPPAWQRPIHIGNHLLIVAFALLIAWLGLKLAILNAGLTSPALEFSLAWLYAPAAVGGVLMALYALRAAASHDEHGIADVKE
jgi:TRAP-type C4-dicarboxylate transport system permease small subunit